MSRQVRNRVTATALGGFLLGAALLTTGTANAEQVEGGGRQVVFAGGGVLGLSCKSTPSVESLTVPADGTVRLVNRTGHGARLRLNGESKGSIPDDGSTEVVFRRGTTAVTLDPSCAITDQATPVLVTASPMLTAGPDPMPAPADSDADPAAMPTAPTGPGAPDAPTDSGSALPDSVAPASRPQQPSTTIAGRPTMTRPNTVQADRAAAQAATTATQAMPHGGAASRAKTRTPARGTAGAVAPAFSGMPPGDDKTILPGVPTLDLPSPPSADAPALPAGPPSGLVAAEPVAAMRPLPESRPVGLLAVIAAVSVFGVAIGVIRAIVSQRASRATVA
ncbi:hypothetical protein [Actinoplanes sp. ATCC 53533]|uniref:hypothetical protein n=1 Tax=Actinoplanes sp. ATCC 53533 TaxID=1288362 RepID=UPI000F7AC0F0|nr:hypothetical protein [Actinoplanes sp. ATCC 53533]